MKLYKTADGIIIEKDAKFYAIGRIDWDLFINDDNLFSKMTEQVNALQGKGVETLATETLKPIGSQELWACGVTYLRSKVGRQEESKASGASDFYAKVYEAERPEVFFKSTANRIVGNNEKVNIRKDSTWDVPEPELILVVSSSGKIVGYTIGNDMSSRSIEGENPLYLPQAKTYDACAAVGPCIYVPAEPIDPSSNIHLSIHRGGAIVFEGNVALDQMKRSHTELVSYVYRECTFATGCYIMTGTGIVPGNDFTLASGDEIKITIDHIGTLVNTVR